MEFDLKFITRAELLLALTISLQLFSRTIGATTLIIGSFLAWQGGVVIILIQILQRIDSESKIFAGD